MREGLIDLAQDRVGPFVNIEFRGGPKDGEMVYGVPFPPSPEVMIVLRPLLQIAAAPAATDDGAIRAGRYAMTDDQRYEKIWLSFDTLRHATKEHGVEELMCYRNPRPMHYTWQGE